MLLVCLSLASAAALSELAAALYVTNVLHQPRTVQVDSRAGWRYLPDIDVRRWDPDGNEYEISTNKDGFRDHWESRPAREHTILVVGDSFAAGFGIPERDRFDHIAFDSLRTYSWMNKAVEGFGTDQEVLVARDDASRLESGDVLLMLTCYNDFLDITRRSFAGRSKPFFTLDDDGSLVEHAPSIGVVDLLRNRSYVFTGALSYLQGREAAEQKWSSGVELYERILAERVLPLEARGVQVVIAHFGKELLPRDVRLQNDVQSVFQRQCSAGQTRCLALDDDLHAACSADCWFRTDGHWTSAGHRIVGNAVRRALASLGVT
ncbi:MAG: hypothetical protein IT307_01705 [Chloroflexi bacterium]|nr:hypothetical protein [Chloroflexota bacterium]